MASFKKELWLQPKALDLIWGLDVNVRRPVLQRLFDFLAWVHLNIEPICEAEDKSPCPTLTQFSQETEAYQWVIVVIGAPTRRVDFVHVPLQAPSPRFASVKQGINLQVGFRQQAHFVLRFVLRLA